MPSFIKNLAGGKSIVDLKAPRSRRGNSNQIVDYWAGGLISFANFDSIATTTVGSGGQATITFNSIPSGYKHLQIRGFAKSAISDATASFTFNGDTAANYSFHGMGGQGSTIADYSSTSTSSMKAFGYNRGMGYDGGVVLIIDILDYADTSKYKVIRSIWGMSSGSSGEAQLVSGNWRSTSAITSMTFTPSSGNFGQYTHFALYGIVG